MVALLAILSCPLRVVRPGAYSHSVASRAGVWCRAALLTVWKVRRRRSAAPLQAAPDRRPHPGGYVIKDATGQTLAYVYARETKAQADAAKVLTLDEARRLASNIAKLPGLLATG